MKNSLVSVLILSFIISAASVFALENKEKTLLIFSAEWCDRCQDAKKDMIDDPILSEQIKNFTIIEVDFDVDKDIVEGYNIKSIPAFVIFNNGKEIKRKIGYRNTKDLINFLK